jgi:hypothetical protein
LEGKQKSDHGGNSAIANAIVNIGLDFRCFFHSLILLFRFSPPDCTARRAIIQAFGGFCFGLFYLTDFRAVVRAGYSLIVALWQRRTTKAE